MDANGIRLRPAKTEAAALQSTTTAPTTTTTTPPAKQRSHPGGASQHGSLMQAWRIISMNVYFLASCLWWVFLWLFWGTSLLLTALSMHATQFMGVPLYFYDRDLYYSWQALTKQHFGLLVVTLQAWWSPTLVRVSGDESVRGQLRRMEDGRLELEFPERMVLLSNHIIYTDWLYLWWSAYAANMHGHIYIILKESLKYIPILGPGMMFFSFVFLSRNWTQDKPRFQHRLKKLTNKHKGPTKGSKMLDPMWLLLFPEGTNISKNGRAKSKAWAEKSGQPDLDHCLLPRSTGLLFTLDELGDSIEWVYDCTLAYEGIPQGEYAQDVFTLRGIYLQGRSPPSVNMHWRRFAVKDIPVHDPKAFERWVLMVWQTKDELLKYYAQHGGFPADEATEYKDIPLGAGVKEMYKAPGWIGTTVVPRYRLEFLQIFAPVAAMGLVGHLVWRFWKWGVIALGSI